MSNEISPLEPEKFEHVQPGYLGPTPPIGQLPRRGARVWVDRPEQLRQAATTLAQAGVIAIDAEFTQVRVHKQGSGSSSVPRLSLLQLAIEQHCFVVDTLRLNDLTPLKAVVENPRTVILLHGSGADIRVMTERGLHVAHYFDLEATCRSIFGQHESSLATMLKRAFHIHLDKSLQRTDWTRRPLPPAMIAYAARDAEVTLALYGWLDQYYHDTLQLHEYNGAPLRVASWIEPFLRGNAPFSPDATIADAQARGIIRNKAQVYGDCRAALRTLIHPMYRNRLLRLIADLSLSKLAPDLVSLLNAPTSDERAGSARALGRLNAKMAREHIIPLLYDPVYDVRKAAQSALRHLSSHEKEQHVSLAHNADGARSWATSEDEQVNDNQHGWKNRLRSMIDAS
ncbi:MAG TPA: hypothetical protein VH593_28295 [Ktedonobacteraceae bacterium]